MVIDYIKHTDFDINREIEQLLCFGAEIETVLMIFLMSTSSLICQYVIPFVYIGKSETFSRNPE